MAKLKYPNGLPRKYKNKIIEDIKTILKYVYYFYSKNIYKLTYKDLDNYITSRKLKRQLKYLFKSEIFDIYEFVQNNTYLFIYTELYIKLLYEIHYTKVVSNNKMTHKTALLKIVRRLQEPHKIVISQIEQLLELNKEFKLENNYELQNMNKLIDNKKAKPYLAPTINQIEWGDNIRRNTYVFNMLISNMSRLNAAEITHILAKRNQEINKFIAYTNTEHIEGLEDEARNEKIKIKVKKCKIIKREKNTIEDLLGSIE